MSSTASKWPQLSHVSTSPRSSLRSSPRSSLRSPPRDVETTATSSDIEDSSSSSYCAGYCELDIEDAELRLAAHNATRHALREARRLERSERRLARAKAVRGAARGAAGASDRLKHVSCCAVGWVTVVATLLAFAGLVVALMIIDGII